jgi:hypothetical protein
MEKQAALGAAVAILQGGEIVYLGGFGTTSIEEGGVQVTPQTLFAYGSIGKNLCAVLIMRLVEQGLLQLDTPIVNYLPTLQFSDRERGRKVTLRHLLSQAIFMAAMCMSHQMVRTLSLTSTVVARGGVPTTSPSIAGEQTEMARQRSDGNTFYAAIKRCDPSPR